MVEATSVLYLRWNQPVTFVRGKSPASLVTVLKQLFEASGDFSQRCLPGICPLVTLLLFIYFLYNSLG